MMFTAQAVVTTFASSEGEADQQDVQHALRFALDCLPQRLCIRCYGITGDTYLERLHEPIERGCLREEDHHQPVTISFEVSV